MEAVEAKGNLVCTTLNKKGRPVGNVHTLCESQDCTYCFERSFASSVRAPNWDSDRNTLTARQVSKKGRTVCWFLCGECNHSFSAVAKEVNKDYKPSWCSYCSNKKLCNELDCQTCFSKSFASSPRIGSWSPKNGNINPRLLFRTKNVKYWFDCENCFHEFELSLGCISKGRWCQYCANKKLCMVEECQVCIAKSFASSHRAGNWSEKNYPVLPRSIFKCSNTARWFDCDDCKNEFCMRPDSITIHNQWCPACKHKTEKKLFKYLISLFSDTVHQKRFDWCRNEESKAKVRFPFDFCIPSLMMLVELDGRQHFEQVPGWETPERQNIRDRYKMNSAITHGYSIIRILQDDVLHNKNNWKKRITDELVSREVAVMILIGDDDNILHNSFARLVNEVELVFED